MKVTNHTDIFGRRDFLKIGSLGALGVNLPSVLRAAAKKDLSIILCGSRAGAGIRTPST